MTTKEDFILKHRTEATASKVSGGQYWRFTWYRVSDGTLWETTVDSTMKNFNQWQHLVNGPVPYGVYCNIRISSRSTNRNTGIATADSIPERTDVIRDYAQTTDWISQIDAVHNHPTNNNFDNLFVQV